MPVAGTLAGAELLEACMNKDGSDKCPHLTAWLNKLILFKLQYDIMNEDSKA